jgi:ParB family transcriptional regulator, chromosome partitioning protein
MALMLEGLDLLGTRAQASDGAPLLLPVADIDEDPAQPRKEFDDAKLAELAETIRQRGVLQAISVRPHPEIAGRWMLNYGSRRLRASKLADKTDIPSFVDKAADDYAQVIENEQREGLTPLELAMFVKRRMSAGDSQAEIARQLGKSRAHITMATAMIDPPDWLLRAYREGRCRGIRELYELRRIGEEAPERVTSLLAGHRSVSRTALSAARERANVAPLTARFPSREVTHAQTAPNSPGSLALHGIWRDQTVEVIVQPLPDPVDHVFVQSLTSRQRLAVPVAEIGALRLVLN